MILRLSPKIHLIVLYILIYLFLFLDKSSVQASLSPEKMVLIPKGIYVPFFPDKKTDLQSNKIEKPLTIQVKAFMMDIYPVTNSEYLDFVKHNHDWSRSKIKRVFADIHYLQNWKDDFDFSPMRTAKSPVTFISWFSAKAFCESKGKELPTVDQWEYVTYDHGRSEKETKERVLSWYSRPNGKYLSSVGSTGKNGFGVYDLQGLIWEWTYDFNNPTGGDLGSFCGGGALGSVDSSDYVNYMRFAFRSSLKASYTTANLGFRCVKEVTE